MAAVVKAREEHDAAHTVEEEARRQALKDDHHGDPVVRLLHITQTAACAQCEKAIDAFLFSIKKTLQKHVPMHAQGPLISNTLSTTFQFQMSVWHMIGKECIRLVRVKHSDWRGLAGIVQAICNSMPLVWLGLTICVVKCSYFLVRHRVCKITLLFCFGGSRQSLKVREVKCIPRDPATMCPVLFKGSHSLLLLA